MNYLWINERVIRFDEKSFSVTMMRFIDNSIFKRQVAPQYFGTAQSGDPTPAGIFLGYTYLGKRYVIAHFIGGKVETTNRLSIDGARLLYKSCSAVSDGNLVAYRAYGRWCVETLDMQLIQDFDWIPPLKQKDMGKWTQHGRYLGQSAGVTYYLKQGEIVEVKSPESVIGLKVTEIETLEDGTIRYHLGKNYYTDSMTRKVTYKVGERLGNEIFVKKENGKNVFLNIDTLEVRYESC